MSCFSHVNQAWYYDPTTMLARHLGMHNDITMIDGFFSVELSSLSSCICSPHAASDLCLEEDEEGLFMQPCTAGLASQMWIFKEQKTLPY